MEKPRRRRAHSRVSRSSNEEVLGSDCGSCGSGAFAELELFGLDRGRVSSRLSPGTPMRKLLADEMSKETETKRRSPSVIARLMGLDGMPSQQSSNKQRNRNSEDCQPHRKSVKGQQRFKDVYEVDGSLIRETRCNSSRSRHDDVAFIRQKFLDAKRFSTDEKLQNSKEFHDALEVLDSNKDILLKFLQQPDSLFLKHLNKLRGAPEGHCERVLNVKSMNTKVCDIDAVGGQSCRKTSPKIDASHCHKHRDSCCGDSCHTCDIDSRKLSFLEEAKEFGASVPTRIVVLKPNLGKVQTNGSSVFSPSPSDVQSSDIDLHSESSNIGKTAHHEFGNHDSRFRESRQLAREITRSMRSNWGIDSFNVSSFGHKGYSADESGHEMCEHDSSYDSEATIISSQASLSRNIHNKASTSHYGVSSVNREGKRKLSERWKMTRRSHLVGASGEGSTLAEMLAIPDMDIRPRSPDIVVSQDEYVRRSGSNARTAQLMSPLGISSRDGWKDGSVRNLPRSSSLPASSNHLGTSKSSPRHEMVAAERFLLRTEGNVHLTNSSIKKGSTRKEVSVFGSTKSSHSESKSFCPITSEVTNDAQVVQSGRDMMTKSVGGKDSFEVKTVILEISSCRHDTSLVLHSAVDEELINASESRNCPEKQASCLSTTCGPQSVQQEPSTNSDVRGSSCLQYAATQPESPVSSKESEQPSPVSVLETPFVEELSSGSECFERVNADLHGLRMQLQLLKLESEAYDEGLNLISGDEDVVELPSKVQDCKRFLLVAECWESCYLVDVLTESELNRTDPEFFLATWHSPDCPIGLWVFENLEEKYGAWETCLRSERRLMFDRINSKIIEISQQFLNLYPWVKQRRTVADQWWKHGWFETELLKLLKIDEKQTMQVAMDAGVLDNMRWLELGVDVHSIGRTIEELLVDELVAEILPM